MATYEQTAPPSDTSRNDREDEREDDSGTRMPRLWTRTIGELTLSYVPDAGVAMIPGRVYPSSAASDWSPYRPHMTDAGHLAMGCGALLVERGGTRLLLDAGHGHISGEEPEHFQHGFAHVKDLPVSLASLGVDPAELETVAFTHLHEDHTGWARPDAVAGGHSLFPNARWIVGEGELRGGVPASGERLAGERLAGERTRTTTAADGTEIAEGVRAWALPGHTPGHTAWVLDAGDGRRIVAFGDAMHSPVQVRHPDWEVVLDHDRDMAERSRRRLVEFLAQDGVYGFGVHFADQQLGTVDGTGRWRPWDDAKDAR
ncbi:MBL fold metallo-hydrolase [Streptomyces sp. SID3343]|uniref:MBL fold metallo-hydrolase n=1 Tax=Streptomyces sp. SID3343 TaxID=2690260 RepID=UPI00136EA4A9|nr:MBL fold metallo-hydrolase [Streptomyces sp. SID3343]MYV96699.1 MBL fold metallo-hydrolase [Streptomyces sp. SID3343]